MMRTGSCQRIVFRRLWPVAALLMLCAIPDSAYTQADFFSYKGYVKQLGSLSVNDQLTKSEYNNIIQLRLETTWRLASGWRVQADARNRYFTGHTVRNFPGYGDLLESDPGYFNLSHNFVDSHNMILNTMVDRLHLSYVNGPWEMHVGRQRLNWGKSMVWNPNDLFNAYAYLDFDYEERPGTDAVNVQYNWSFASSLEVGVKIADDFDESVIAAMYRGNIGTYDIQLLAGKYLERFVMGAGWSGYVKGAGFKGEVSYFTPKEDISGSFSASLGSDYMFSNGIFGSVELLYNGGWKRGLNPLESISQPPSASNLFISDTGYFLNASATPHPLMNIGFGLMGSFTRSIVVVIPQFGYSLAENLDFLVLVQTFRGTVFDEQTDMPNVLFARFKWSF